MGDRQYQVERRQRDHNEDHEVSSIGPCSLLQEVHDERRDSQVRSRKNDRVSTCTNSTHDQVRVVGAVPVFDSKDEVIVVDHAYNKSIKVGDRDVMEQHHDRERKENRHDTVLFGLFSGDHKERNIQHDVCVDGKLSQYSENSTDHTVKFLGITISHSHHMDNDSEREQREREREIKPRYNPPRRAGKGW